MKRFAICLLWLAIAKIALVEHLQRAALADAVRAAYQTAALRTCAEAARTASPDLANSAWTDPARIEVSAGNRSRSVGLWQVDHADWSERYRKAKVVVEPAGPKGPRCRYDVASGVAALHAP